MRRLALWSPMIVLFTWAAVLAVGFETRGVTVGGRVLLGVTLTLHIREEFRGRRA